MHIDTPLGPVTFVARPGADVVISKAEPRIPDHFPRVTLWTATFRFAARQDVEVTARLTATAPDVGGGPGSGEWLDAVTLENDSATVSIGGPDEDRLLEELGVEGTVEYLDDRTITWRLSSAAELTIAVAWSELTSHPATWVAVDLPFRNQWRGP
ncbi:hypothetical protein UK23_27935 [Lentzea aerocolonigenes]|uniref:Uncharacterized protein n=1 Tax=Lentzea aerocolonigenes TaxID=68170 RepID=A0A0F0GMY5_LENAE|nr:hypothetical protein [Lentzea aerocolonigenes]KJK44874.1 hypothetical protein UK23_27935 [Lentzea aerocolonigenes]